MDSNFLGLGSLLGGCQVTRSDLNCGCTRPQPDFDFSAQGSTPGRLAGRNADLPGYATNQGDVAPESLSPRGETGSAAGIDRLPKSRSDQGGTDVEITRKPTCCPCPRENDAQVMQLPCPEWVKNLVVRASPRGKVGDGEPPEKRVISISSSSSAEPAPLPKEDELRKSLTPWWKEVLPEASRHRAIMRAGTRVVVTASPLTGKVGTVDSFDKEGDPRILMDGAGQPICVLRKDVLPFISLDNRYTVKFEGTTEQLGLALSSLPPGPVFVRTIVPQGWAANNGINPGDELVNINGAPVSDMVPTRFDDVLESARPLSFTFLRPEELTGKFYVGERAEVCVVDTGEWMSCTVVANGATDTSSLDVQLDLGGPVWHGIQTRFLRPQTNSENGNFENGSRAKDILKVGDFCEVVVLDTGHWLPCHLVSKDARTSLWTVKLFGCEVIQEGLLGRHIRKREKPKPHEMQDLKNMWRRVRAVQNDRIERKHQALKDKQLSELHEKLQSLQLQKRSHEKENVVQHTELRDKLTNNLETLAIMNKCFRAKLKGNIRYLLDPDIEPDYWREGKPDKLEVGTASTASPADSPEGQRSPESMAEYFGGPAEQIHSRQSDDSGARDALLFGPLPAPVSSRPREQAGAEQYGREDSSYPSASLPVKDVAAELRDQRLIQNNFHQDRALMDVESLPSPDAIRSAMNMLPPRSGILNLGRGPETYDKVKEPTSHVKLQMHRSERRGHRLAQFGKAESAENVSRTVTFGPSAQS